jgi:hypothetical protein
MGVQSADVDHGEVSLWVVDPHAHHDHVELAQAPLLDPAWLEAAGVNGGSVDAIAQPLSLASAPSRGRSRGRWKWLLAKYRNAGRAAIHGRLVVVATFSLPAVVTLAASILTPLRALLHRVEGAVFVLRRRLVRPLLDYVAYGHNLDMSRLA